MSLEWGVFSQNLDTGGDGDEAGGDLDEDLSLGRMRGRGKGSGLHVWKSERQNGRRALRVKEHKREDE